MAVGPQWREDSEPMNSPSPAVCRKDIWEVVKAVAMAAAAVLAAAAAASLGVEVMMAAHTAAGLAVEATWELVELEAETTAADVMVAASRVVAETAACQEAEVRVEMKAAVAMVEEVVVGMAGAQVEAWVGALRGNNSRSTSRQCCCWEFHTEQSLECLHTVGRQPLQTETAAKGRSQQTSLCEIAGRFDCGSKRGSLPTWRGLLLKAMW